MSRLPNAIIVGGQKCGSSWLLENLRKHPEIFAPREEVHFFDKEHNFQRGTDWYAGHFIAATEKHRVVLEKTPDYLFGEAATEGHMPDSAKRIHTLLPSCKILIILRNPAIRAVSAVQHIIRSGRIPPETPIRSLLLGDKEALVSGHGVVEYGFYHQDVQRYIDLFSRDQVLIQIYEDVMADKAAALREAFEFLGVVEEFSVENQEAKVNAPTVNRFLLALKYYLPFLTKISVLKKLKPLFKGSKSLKDKEEGVVSELMELYEEDVSKLGELLGRDVLWGVEIK